MYQTMLHVSYNQKDAEALKIYNQRKNSESAINTALVITPFSPNTEMRVAGKKFELFIVTLPEFLKLLEKITIKSQEITELLKQNFPEVARYRLILSKIIKEIQSTNEIEGVKSSRKDLKAALDSLESNKEVRFKGIANMYLSILQDEKLAINSLQDIRDIYDRLFLEEIDEEDRPDGIYFRKESVQITGNDKVVHRGAPSEDKINQELTELIRFMNSSELPYLLKAIITHYYFEYIHPFYDGNGRMGRFLLSSYLAKKLDLFSGISISESILNSRNRYEKIFAVVSNPRNYGDLTIFVLDMLKMIYDGQENALEELNLSKAKLEHISQVLEASSFTEDEKKVMTVIFEQFIFDVSDERLSNKIIFNMINSENKISRKRIDDAFLSLEEKKVVQKVKKKPLVYILTEKGKKLLD